MTNKKLYLRLPLLHTLMFRIDGVFNMALTTTNNTAFSLASRESGANAPQLIIETLP